MRPTILEKNNFKRVTLEKIEQRLLNFEKYHQSSLERLLKLSQGIDISKTSNDIKTTNTQNEVKRKGLVRKNK